MHRSPGICLMAEVNPGKSQLGNHGKSHCLRWGPLTPNNVGIISQHIREENEGKDGEGLMISVLTNY